MPCYPKCIWSSWKDKDGRDLMISRPGNTEFPNPGTVHPQCIGCIVAETFEKVNKCLKDFMELLDKQENTEVKNP
jgi:hypothetical protein